MADRYLVATGNWTAANTAIWSATDGGAPGASVPTAADNVFMTAASGAVTVTIATDVAVCLNLDTSGFTGTIAGTSTGITISGSMVLGAGTTWSHNRTITFNATTAQTIRTNGVSIGSGPTFNGVGGSWTLLDDFLCPNTVTVTNGSFVSNGFSVTVSTFASNNSNVRTVDLTDSLVILTNTTTATLWNFATTTNLTFISTGSTIRMTGSSTSTKTFAGGGLTYNNYHNATGNTGGVDFTGSNTFNGEFRLDPGRTHRFTAGTTQTFNGPFIAHGTAASGISILSITAASHTLTKSSGSVSVSYCTIARSTAEGGAVWNATISRGNTDGSNNSGWVFTAQPVRTVSASLSSGNIVGGVMVS